MFYVLQSDLGESFQSGMLPSVIVSTITALERPLTLFVSSYAFLIKSFA